MSEEEKQQKVSIWRGPSVWVLVVLAGILDAVAVHTFISRWKYTLFFLLGALLASIAAASALLERALERRGRTWRGVEFVIVWGLAASAAILDYAAVAGAMGRFGPKAAAIYPLVAILVSMYATAALLQSAWVTRAAAWRVIKVIIAALLPLVAMGSCVLSASR